jgi:hypothetical protein
MTEDNVFNDFQTSFSSMKSFVHGNINVSVYNFLFPN